MKRALIAMTLFSGAAMADDGHPNIYNFQGTEDGNGPRGSLITDSQGNLYGTAAFGGTFDNGNVYELVPAADGVSPAKLTVLYSFTGADDGSLPSAGLVADAAGNLYGTTAMDGAALRGTVFRLSPPVAGQTAWTETTLWSFGAGTDGRHPVGNLIIGPDGSLFGTTNWGGTNGQGTVFELSSPNSGTQWVETTLWNFTGNGDGAQPIAGLLLGSGGQLYGTTVAGGTNGVGTVFSVTPSSDGTPATLATLWNFTGGSDGSEPGSTLVAGTDGALYGTATFGGSPTSTCWQSAFPFYNDPLSWSSYALTAAYIPAGGNDCGVVFRLTPGAGSAAPWNLTTLYSFMGTPDSGTPLAGATFLPNGNLIGFTVSLGKAYYGAAYELAPPKSSQQSWKFSRPVSFNADAEGLWALGSPVNGVAGRVYGTMYEGGNTWKHVKCAGYGVIFSVEP